MHGPRGKRAAFFHDSTAVVLVGSMAMVLYQQLAIRSSSPLAFECNEFTSATYSSSVSSCVSDGAWLTSGVSDGAWLTSVSDACDGLGDFDDLHGASGDASASLSSRGPQARPLSSPRHCSSSLLCNDGRISTRLSSSAL